MSWWTFAAGVVFAIAALHAYRMFRRWQERRYLEQLQDEYESADVIELPDNCHHSPWPTEECGACHHERSLIERGEDLPDEDQQHPLPLPSEQALELLMQLQLDKWIPPWSLEFRTGNRADLEEMLGKLHQYGMIETRDGERPRPDVETEVMLTARGWTSRGEDRTVSHVVAVTEE